MRSMEGLPRYSTLEVAKHTSAEDAWLIIGGNVLDVTTWLGEHPGGDDVLLDLAGRDATREFEDVGHSEDARSRLDALVIGTVHMGAGEEGASRTGGSAAGKAVDGMLVPREVLYGWVNDHLNSLKRVGTMGLAGVATIATVMFLKRYGSRLLPWGRR